MKKHAERKKNDGGVEKPLRVPEEWIGGRFSMQCHVMEGEPYRPDLIVWIDLTHDQVTGADVVSPGEPRTKDLDVLLEAMRRPMAGPARKPGRIRTAEPALADLLRERLGSDVEVEVGPTPEMERFADLLSQAMSVDADELSYFEGGRVAPETVARFFRAAARLYRAEPWAEIDDGQLIRLDCTELGEVGKCVSIIGSLGESYGVLIFDSVEGHRALAERGEDLEQGRTREAGVRIFSINFERGADLPKNMRREVRTHGWEVANSKAYPRIQWIDPDSVLKPLGEREVVYATVCALALASFFEKHSPALEEGRFESAHERVALEDLPGRPVVEITAPHPDEPWWDEDTEEGDEEAEDLAEGEEEPELRAAKAVVEQYLARRRDQGRDESWLNDAGFVCESLYEFKVHYAGEAIEKWTPLLVEQYLFDYFPRKVSATADLVERTPALLLDFFEWLGSEGRVSTKIALAARALIARSTRDFLREARDPANFGIAKSFVMNAEKAGVDFSNRAEVDAFIAKQNAEGLPFLGPSSGRFPGWSAGTAPEERQRPRWEWSDEGPRPASDDPCPCGSGRRYKKCCKRR